MLDLLINSVTVFRILVIGGFLLILPRTTRRGLLFGSYVGEAVCSSAAARRLVRAWYQAVLGVSLASLLVAAGLVVAGRALAGNRVSLLVMLIAAAVIYLRFHYAARRLVPSDAARPNAGAPPIADAPEARQWSDEPRFLALPVTTLVLCLIAGAATFVFAALSYPDLPAMIPSHAGASGQPDAWYPKSLVSVMTMPLWALLFGPWMAVFGLLAARAKRSLRLGDDRSVLAQNRFRAAFVRLICGSALLATAVFAWISVQLIRIGLGRATALGPGFWWLAGLAVFFAVAYQVRLLVHYGQGGALIEDAGAPLTDGLADNRRWLLGIFYVDRDDPAIMIEERFGLGYTVNLGNPAAIAITAGFLATLGVLMALAFAAG